MQLSTFQKGLLFVILASLFFGGILFVNRICFGDAFNKEEAQHAVYGLWLNKDIRALDLGNFGYDTQRQMYWPFLHSWILAVFFLFTGISYISARSLSLFISIATFILMYLASTRFCPKHGRRIGVMAVILALFSPMVVRFATETTLESLGALIFMASFFFYTICEEKKNLLEYIILGILIGLSIYTNYLYAYLMIPAFVIVTVSKLGPLVFEGVHLAREGEKAALAFLWWAYKKLIVFLVLLLFVGAWFLTSSLSRKIMLFLQAIFHYSGGEALNFWQGILYYPKIIIENYSFSPWLGVLIIVSLLKPFVAANYRQVNKLFTFVWTVLVLITLTVPTKAPQFIYIIAPFLFIIFSAALFYWIDRFPKYQRAILAVVIIPALISLPVAGRLYFPAHNAENMVGVLDYFHQQVPAQTSIAAAFNLQHLNPETMAFHFWDWKAPVFADPVAGTDELFHGGQRFLTIELSENSPYQTENFDDSLLSWNSFLAEKLKVGEIRETSTRNFSSIGVIAKIYEKQASLSPIGPTDKKAN